MMVVEVVVETKVMMMIDRKEQADRWQTFGEILCCMIDAADDDDDDHHHDVF